MKVSSLDRFPRHGSFESQGKVYTGLVVPLVRPRLSPISVIRGPDRPVLTADEVVAIGARGSDAVRWDDVTGTSRTTVKRKPVLEVEHAGGVLQVPLWALEGSEATRLERLIRACAHDPEERRRVASGGPGSRGGWPAASG